MSQVKAVRWGWIILGIVVLVVASGLWLQTADGNIQYYMTVSEYLERQSKYEGKKIKLAGKVAAGTLKVEGQRYQFQVEDLGKMILVHYEGFAPDTFKEGAEVVVEGRGSTGESFQATSLMAKCASKYEAGGLPPLESMRGKSVY